MNEEKLFTIKTHHLMLEGQKVSITQRGNTFKVIRPLKNEDGTINWFNFFTGGSWWNLVLIAFIILVVLGTLNEYASNMQVLLNCFENPIQLEICKASFGPK